MNIEHGHKTRQMKTVLLTVCILYSDEQTRTNGVTRAAIVIIINLCAKVREIRYQRLNTGKCLDAFYALVSASRIIIK